MPNVSSILTSEKYQELIAEYIVRQLRKGGPGSGWFREDGHVPRGGQTEFDRIESLKKDEAYFLRATTKEEIDAYDKDGHMALGSYYRFVDSKKKLKDAISSNRLYVDRDKEPYVIIGKGNLKELELEKADLKINEGEMHFQPRDLFSQFSKSSKILYTGTIKSLFEKQKSYQPITKSNKQERAFIKYTEKKEKEFLPIIQKYFEEQYKDLSLGLKEIGISTILKGGAGSGNHGHAGRPGRVGGSGGGGGNVQLSSAQKEAIAACAERGELTEGAINSFIYGLKDQYDIKGVTPEQVKAFSKKIADECEVTVCGQLTSDSRSWADFSNNGRLKNQFELGELATSNGCLSPYKNSSRDEWEGHLFKDAYRKSEKYLSLEDRSFLTEDLARERPVYGCMADHREFTRSAAYQYGNVQMVLSNKVKSRTTITCGNSSSAQYGDIGTIKDNANILRAIVEKGDKDRYTKKYLEKAVKNGEFKASDFINPGRYINYTEAQIHGGVDWRRGDIKKIYLRYDSSDISDFATDSLPKIKKRYQHIIDWAKDKKIPVEFKP